MVLLIQSLHKDSIPATMGICIPVGLRAEANPDLNFNVQLYAKGMHDWESKRPPPLPKKVLVAHVHLRIAPLPPPNQGEAFKDEETTLLRVSSCVCVCRCLCV